MTVPPATWLELKDLAWDLWQTAAGYGLYQAMVPLRFARCCTGGFAIAAELISRHRSSLAHVTVALTLAYAQIAGAPISPHPCTAITWASASKGHFRTPSATGFPSLAERHWSVNRRQDSGGTGLTARRRTPAGSPQPGSQSAVAYWRRRGYQPRLFATQRTQPITGRNRHQITGELPRPHRRIELPGQHIER